LAVEPWVDVRTATQKKAVLLSKDGLEAITGLSNRYMSTGAPP
jgi:hypothetical protein